MINIYKITEKINIRNFFASNFKRKVAAICSFVLVLCIVFLIVIPSATTVSALEVKCNNKVVGYVENKKTLDVATQIVAEKTEDNPTQAKKIVESKITTSEIKCKPETLNSAATLSDKIVENVDEFYSGFGIYVGDTLLFATDDEKESTNLVDGVMTLAEKNFKSEDIKVENGISVIPGNYIRTEKTSKISMSIEDLYKKLNFISYKYKTKTVSLKYDKVYIVNSNLSLGETNDLSEGKNGKGKYTYKFTYKNGKLIKKKLDSFKVSAEPKAQTTTVSQEEYNILTNKTINTDEFSLPIDTEKYYVSSLYGHRWGKIFNGIDFAVEEGTKINSYQSGTVTKKGENSSDGKFVVVKHENKLVTKYTHCSSILVSKGDTVTKGQNIALSGSTGNAKISCVHFEMLLNGKRTNPASYLGIYVDESEDSKKVNRIVKSVNLSGSHLDFINSIKSAAIEAYQHYNILPSLTLAQAIIESAWGESAIGNNIFGIKAYSDWKGAKKYVWTSEQRSNGTYYKTQAWFKDYDSIADSVYDHTRLLLSSRYKKVRQADNYIEACYAIQEAGYATSSTYAQTLIDIIETYSLYTWDDINYKVADNHPKATTATTTKATTTKDKTQKASKTSTATSSTSKVNTATSTTVAQTTTTVPTTEGTQATEETVTTPYND